jgi:CheY-like chemotaxis protein/HPt (histidine-containing phosphotransfer) domain-containing protein
MDKNIPEMDGIETMHHLIELGLKKYLKKVILITEYDISAEKELLEQLSIDHFVNKPINHSVLLDAIMVAFQRKKTTSKKKRKAKVKQNKVVGECLVLLVDDNEINRDLAKDLLNSIGIEVDLASDGEEALEKMKASGKPSKYCLVFMDLQMPIMDGFETTEKIRTFDTDIPIVALTADLDPQIKKKIKKSGLNDSVAKPIDPVQIIKKLKKWVKNVEISAVKKSSYQKQKEEQNKLHSLKHVYVTNALERTGGKYENLISALKKFEKKYRKFISVFSSIEDKEEKLSYVHTVKGVSGNIGAIYLHKLLIQLEDNLRKDKDIDELLDLIEVEINFLTEEIRAIPFKGKTKNEKAQKLSPYDFKNTLEKLKTMLKEGDADALKVLKLMEENFENKKDFQEIHNLVLNYDYDEALNKLNNLFDLA